jgi:hypothetical protein
MKIKLLSFI